MSGKKTGETYDIQNPQWHHVRALAPVEKCLLASDLASLSSRASGRAALGQEWLCSPSWLSMSVETSYD